MKIVSEILIAIAIVVGAFFLGRSTTPTPDAEVRIKTDTIRVVEVRPDTIYQDKYITRYLKTTDTLTVTQIDSVLVYVPINTYIFQDSTYRAEVQGYEVELKSMEVYNKTIYETKVVKVNNRWGVGVQVGYGICGTKLSPYVGVGVSCNLITW